MKTYALRDLLGKRIVGVVAKRTRIDRPPYEQLFLVFDDSTYFEIYGELHPAGGVDSGGIEAVRAYLGRSMEIIFEAELE